MERDVLFASFALELRAVVCKLGATKVAAKGQAEDHPHVDEMVCRTRLGREAEVGIWCTPRVRLGDAVHEVRWHVRALPEPRADVPCHWVPLSSVDTAAASVELLPNGARWTYLRAPLIVPLVGSVHIAAVCSIPLGASRPRSREILTRVDAGLVAVRIRVQRRHDVACSVHALDDVVLAPLGPDVVLVLPIQPEGRPRAAACGYVVQGYDKQTGVEHIERLDPHRTAAHADRLHSLGVGAYEDLVHGGLHEASRRRLFAADIMHSPL
mmetsp:Transcript_90696/g.210993  ORF Transcript_90696/g.210993 Transcript_90696/m.210993 type:complete len:268 (-) Transcript_90696:174-977(-)